MSEATPIRPPRKSAALVSVASMNTALNDQGVALYQAMGIIRLATTAVRDPAYDREVTDAWTALDAAYAILSGIADRLQDTESMLAEEVPRGEY